MYYEEIKRAALNNDGLFHLAAFAKHRSGFIIGINRNKSSTKFRRIKSNGAEVFSVHAEMDLLRQFDPHDMPKKISVIRFTKKGLPTMSMPCPDCQNFLKRRGVKLVRYTDWDGEWQILELE